MILSTIWGKSRKMSSSATAPWKQLLLNSLHSNSHLKHSSYFQLATVGSNGRPSNRTVVFRGFQDGTDKIQINTDSRSRKIEDLKHCPFAEVCWYFTETWEQFRIHGKVDMIDASNSEPDKLKQREAAWFAGSVRSRLQYLGSTPGLPSLDEQPPHNSLDPSAGPVDAFCLLVLEPEQVDYLNLKSNERLVFSTGRSVNGELERVRDALLRVNNNGTINSGSKPGDMSMPEKCALLLHQSELIGEVLSSLYGALCYVRRAIGPTR